MPEFFKFVSPEIPSVLKQVFSVKYVQYFHYNQWQANLPSRFVDDLPAAHVERVSNAGLYGGRQHQEDGWSGSWNRPAPQQRWQKAPVIETTWKSETRASSATAFRPGDRVFHQKFGYGSVVAADGNKLEIAFDKAGTKKVIDSFVTAG